MSQRLSISSSPHSDFERSQMSTRKSQAGFTLIELLIVITVLGILSTIVVVAVGSTRKDSVASSCKTNFRSIELSAEAVQSKTGNYPLVVGTPAWTNQTTVDTAFANLLNDGSNGATLKHYPFST